MARIRSGDSRGAQLPGPHLVRLLGVLTVAVGLTAAVAAPATAAGKAGPAELRLQDAVRPASQSPPAGLRQDRSGSAMFDRVFATRSGGRDGSPPPGGARSPAPNDPWRLQPTPNPALANGVLYGESCSSSAACTVVGDYENTFGTEVTLAERWNGTSWAVQAAAVPPGAVWSELAAVSCTSPVACTAVGYYLDRGEIPLTFAEHWNGTRWAIQPTPDLSGYQSSGLFAVSCSSARACTAVGAAATTAKMVTLAERWNGHRWSIQPTRNPAGNPTSQLVSVSCQSTRGCTAAGSSVTTAGTQVTLAERWNGTKWAVQATANPAGFVFAELSAASCSSARSCVAVGSYGLSSAPYGVTEVLVEVWNGTKWRLQPAPSPAPPVGVHSGSGLLAVSCTSPRACSAAGFYTSRSVVVVPLAERWNGGRWSIERPPNPAASLGGGLSAISCSATQDCAAAGSYQVVTPPGTFGNLPTPARTLGETWSGKSWRMQPTLDRNGAAVFNDFSAVSCSSPRACTAVGDYQNGPLTLTGLAEAWNGSHWRIQATPTPKGTTLPGFNGVSCTSPNACTAVGSDTNSALTELTLAERWNGARWVIQPTPKRSNAALSGVSCTSARACTAVGSVGKSGLLAEVWNGASWRVRPVPAPAGGTGGVLAGVSCESARACTSVGSYTTKAGKRLTLAETWNGTRWRARPTPDPKGAASAQLNDVSCLSVRACAAVGVSTVNVIVGKQSVPEPRPLAEIWNGTSWHIVSTPKVKGAVSSVLDGVSCTSARACTAVGSWVNSIGGILAVVEAWNGTRWKLQTPASPPGSVDSGLGGVSCRPATFCTAVGWFAGLSGIQLTLAMGTGRTS
jgi:hypothetical protein